MARQLLSQWRYATLALALLALAAGAISVTPALAAGPTSTPAPQAQASRILGIVPARGAGGQIPQAALRLARSNNLLYHNGPVMRTNTVYSIYWAPSGYTGSANYRSLIDGFLKNVAADNGKTTNVYYSDTQYKDTTGAIAYHSTFGGSAVDTTPFPANGCTDQYTAVCLDDSQIQAEVARVMAAKSWTGGPTHLFLVFTPRNVGSCAGGSCAYTTYCAYHSWFGSGSSVVLYANQAYASFVSSACDVGVHPNGDDADATINLVSHEHNEAITDEQGSAWWDRNGFENGDKCAWTFGSAIGNTSYGAYNQVIGTGKYYLQAEWSNATTRCVLTGK